MFVRPNVEVQRAPKAIRWNAGLAVRSPVFEVRLCPATQREATTLDSDLPNDDWLCCAPAAQTPAARPPELALRCAGRRRTDSHALTLRKRRCAQAHRFEKQYDAAQAMDALRDG